MRARTVVGSIAVVTALGLIAFSTELNAWRGPDWSQAADASAPAPQDAPQALASLGSAASDPPAEVESDTEKSTETTKPGPRELGRINPLRDGPAPLEVHNVTCPAYRFRGSKSADAKHTHEAMVKYTRYVGQYCNSTGLLQMHVDLATYLRFLDTVARIVRMKPGDFIFDWGSGCGTMLNYYQLTHGTSGVGIDVTEAAVLHARAHARGSQLFCHMDGSDLRTFPSNTFDAVVSWATLYHVRRTLVQCEIVHHLVRMLKPGGIAYIGHLRTEKTQEYWKKNKCHPPDATIVRYRDARTFHMPAFRRNNFFSLVVTKANATEPPT